MTTSTTRSMIATADLIEPLIRFEGAPAEFLAELIEAQCRVGRAESGAIIRMGRQGVEVIAIFPQIDPQQAPVWLAQAREMAADALGQTRAKIVPLRQPDELYGAQPSRFLALLPMRAGTDVRGVAAFVLDNMNEGQRLEAVQRLELTASLLALYEMRLTLSARAASLNWLKQACGVLWEVNSHRRFRAAAMALCNQVATTWDAERVSVGLHKGRYIRLVAQSHTEKFTRKTELVRGLEAAMEECFDQDAEVLYPASPESPVISRATGELSKRFGPCTVLSLPLRRDDEVVGVMTIERSPERGFELEEVEALRLTCNLCTPRLLEMSERDRWFGARMASGVRDSAAWFVGPTHTWIKLLAIALLGLILFAVFVPGTYRVDAPFTIEATNRHVIAAPFSGFLKTSAVKVGDTVVAGETVLAELNTAELRLEVAELKAQIAGYLTEANKAKQEGKTADERVARSEIERLEARMDLLDYQIEQARIVSPIDGIVVAGDLTQVSDAPVEVGQTLFEIAHPDDLHARLAVGEDDISQVEVGQTGELATVALVHDKLPFTVERIDPVAEVIDQRNVFSLRARLDQRPEGFTLKPGMKGLAKIDAGEHSYGYIWTRDLVNWIRMKLWI